MWEGKNDFVMSSYIYHFVSVCSNIFICYWQRIHCGCVASRYLHEYMDFGGVGCITCVKHLEIHSSQLLQVR